MPTIENPRLTLTEQDGRVRMRVTYNARFTPFERQLVGLGMSYHTHINVHGSDTGPLPPSLPGAEFPRHTLDVTVGDTEQLIVDEVETHSVSRGTLQEDPVGDPDELICNVRVHSAIPPEFTADAFTDQEILTSL